MYLEMVFGALIFVCGVLLGVGIASIIKQSKFNSGEWIKKDSWIRVRCPHCNEGFVSKDWLEIHLENDCKGRQHGYLEDIGYFKYRFIKGKTGVKK